MSEENKLSALGKRHDEDCLGCRLVSGFGVFGVGIYLYSISKKQKSSFNRGGILILSLGACGIGIARLLELPPFRSSTKKK